MRAVLCLILLACTGCLWAAPVVVYEPDGVVPSIVVAEGDVTLSQAAAELKAYLDRMTLSEVAVVSSGAPAREGAFVIELRVAAGGDGLADLQPESFETRVSPGRCTVRAADEAGLWFAVYTLLEALGCRFYFPGDLGENVPSGQELTLDEGNAIEAPDFIHRNVWWAYGRRPDWQAGLYRDWRRKTKMGGVGASMGHNLMRIVPQATFGQTHPEYFPLIDGERDVPDATENHGWQPCTSNPEVIQLAINAAIRHFDQNPDAYSFSLSPNDGYGWCECDACVAQDPEQYRSQPNRGKGRRTLVFANAVAKELAKVHPDKYVAWYAYAGAVEPPDDVRAHRNVVTVIAHYGWCGCNFHTIEDPACKLNAGFREIMEGWAKVADRLFVREYFTTLVPATDLAARTVGAYSLAEDMAYFKRNNVIGVNSESVPDYGSGALNFYLAAKTMWNADEDVEALKSDWFQGMYGPAAATMREYTEWIVSTVRARGCRASQFDADDLAKLREFLDKATSEATSEKQIARVAMTREVLDFMALSRDYYLKPNAEARDKINAMLADIEAGQRLSVDFKAHRARMGKLPTINRDLLKKYVADGMKPLSPNAELPADAPAASPSVRGTHGHSVYLARGETLHAQVTVRRLGRYLQPTTWAVVDPAGEIVEEGAASIEGASDVEYIAEAEGSHVLVTASGANACRVTVGNQFAGLADREPHFLGATPWLFFTIAPGTEEARIRLSTSAPGETGRLIVRDPAGEVVFDEETGENAAKVSAALSGNVDGVWSMRITRASAGVCEDMQVALGEGVVPCLSLHPARLMAPAAE